MLRIKPLWRRRCCALAVCGYGEGGREATKSSTPVPVPPGFSRVAGSSVGRAIADGKQRVAVLRIKPLWRRRCCALAVCGYGEGGREASDRGRGPVYVRSTSDRVEILCTAVKDAKCQSRPKCAAAKSGLFDDLVSAGKHCRWQFKAKRLGGLQLEHQLKSRRR